MNWKDAIKKNESEFLEDTNLPSEVQEAIRVAVSTVAKNLLKLKDDRIYSILGASRSNKGSKNYATPNELINEYVDNMRNNLINITKKRYGGKKNS